MADPALRAGLTRGGDEVGGFFRGLHARGAAGEGFFCRQAARERKDFAVADALRDGLASSGIVVEDTPTGARWSLAEES